MLFDGKHKVTLTIHQTSKNLININWKHINNSLVIKQYFYIFYKQYFLNFAQEHSSLELCFFLETLLCLGFV